MAIVGLEWVAIIVVVALLFFGGGKKISEFARDLGRAAGEFRKGREEIEKEMKAAKGDAENVADEIKKSEKE